MSNKRIIEIDGVKLEVDLQNAKEVRDYKVGDYIKVLTKEYQDYKAYIGTIVGFDNFKDHPTIVIAYLKTSYNNSSIQYIYFNKETKDVEITHLNDFDLPLKKSTILEQFSEEIFSKKQELKELERKQEMFETLFGKHFESVAS